MDTALSSVHSTFLHSCANLPNGQFRSLICAIKKLKNIKKSEGNPELFSNHIRSHVKDLKDWIDYMLKNEDDKLDIEKIKKFREEQSNKSTDINITLDSKEDITENKNIIDNKDITDGDKNITDDLVTFKQHQFPLDDDADFGEEDDDEEEEENDELGLRRGTKHEDNDNDINTEGDISLSDSHHHIDEKEEGRKEEDIQEEEQQQQQKDNNNRYKRARIDSSSSSSHHHSSSSNSTFQNNIQVQIRDGVHKNKTKEEIENMLKKSQILEKKDFLSIYINNIEKDINIKDIRDAMEKKGIDGIKSIEIPLKEDTNESQGFAYVHFVNKADKKMALKHSTFLINEQIIQIFDPISRCVLYLGNLPQISAKELQTILEERGKHKLLHLDLKQDFAFASYENVPEAEEVQENLNEFILEGREITVAFSISKLEDNRFTRANTLYVSGLAPDITHEQLRAKSRPFGGLTKCIVIIDKKTGISKGYGFIEYQTMEGAQSAIDYLNGIEWHGKILEVAPSKPPTKEHEKKRYLSSRGQERSFDRGNRDKDSYRERSSRKRRSNYNEDDVRLHQRDMYHDKYERDRRYHRNRSLSPPSHHTSSSSSQFPYYPPPSYRHSRNDRERMERSYSYDYDYNMIPPPPLPGSSRHTPRLPPPHHPSYPPTPEIPHGYSLAYDSQSGQYILIPTTDVNPNPVAPPPPPGYIDEYYTHTVPPPTIAQYPASPIYSRQPRSYRDELLDEQQHYHGRHSSSKYY